MKTNLHLLSVFEPIEIKLIAICVNEELEKHKKYINNNVTDEGERETL